MNIGDRIRNLRIDHDLTQKELSFKTGVSTITISNWEQGVKLPSTSAIVTLSKVFGVSADFLLGISCQQPLDSLGRYIIDTFSSLDSYGQDAILSLLEIEKNRTEHQTTNGQNKYFIREIPLYDFPSAAGYSSPIDESSYTLMKVSADVPAEADFAVKIQGTSMEPFIKDGETVFVHKQDNIEIGDVGIFCVNGSTYCKQYLKLNDGSIILVSANEALKESNVRISHDSGDYIQCLGKVVMNKKVKIPCYMEKELGCHTADLINHI